MFLGLGCLPVRLVRYCRFDFSCGLFVLVLWRMALDGCLACLDVVYLFMSMGGWDKRDGACQAFDCLDAPAHPLSSPSPASTHKRPRVFFLHPFIARIACRFSFDVSRPVRLITMADGSRHFYAYPSCGELGETARADFGVNSIGLALPSFPWFSFQLPWCPCECVVPLLACLVDDVVPSSYSVPLMPCPLVIHAPSSVYHAVSSLCLPLCISFRLSYRIASLRLSPRPSCRRARRCRIAGVGCLLSLSVRCGIRLAEGAGCLLRGVGGVDVMRR